MLGRSPSKYGCFVGLVALQYCVDNYVPISQNDCFPNIQLVIPMFAPQTEAGGCDCHRMGTRKAVQQHHYLRTMYDGFVDTVPRSVRDIYLSYAGHPRRR